MTAADASRTPEALPAPQTNPPRYTDAAAHAAAWGFVFLILRIFAVSGYDWNTAFAVSTTLGLSDGLSLLLGSLMAGHLLTAVLLTFVLPLLMAAYLWGPHGHRPVVVLFTTIGLVTLVALTVSFHTWWLPPATLVVFAGFALLHGLAPHRPRLRQASTAAMSSVGWVAGMAVLLVAAFVQTPWVPHERIATTDGILTGYVLQVEPGYLNVLTDAHEFVILTDADVRSRS